MPENGRKSAKTPVLAFTVVAALAIVVPVTVRRWRSLVGSAEPAHVRATYTVRRRDLTISVTEAGEIKARSYTDYLCEVEGGPSIVDIVPEGTYISPADVAKARILVQLDSSEIQEHLTQQKITFASAEASYTEAQEALKIQRKQNESDVKAAELAVKFALMDLQKYLSKASARELVAKIEPSDEPADAMMASWIKELADAPKHPRWAGAALQNKRLLESNIKLASGALRTADNRVRWTRQLHQKGYVAASELERDELTHQRCQIEVQQAETALQLFLEYDFPKETEKLFSDYQEAKRHLDRTRASVRAKLAQAQAKHDSAEAKYALQKEQREKLETQLTACTIHATVPGLVIYGTSTDYYARRRDPIEIGDIVHKAQKIITIPNTTEMDAVVRVHESWVERVKPGLPVRITADPFPDDVFTGKILTVAPLPDPQSRYTNTGLKVYTTHVSIDGKHHALGPGMSAKIEIVIDRLKDVLCVPLQAVASRKKLKLCYLVTPNGLDARPVETGQFNDSFIEIKAGLSEGDVVSLLPPRLDEEREDGKRKKRGG